MAENTQVAEATEQKQMELVAKDFTESMVVKIKDKEKFGLSFPDGYNYTNEMMSAMLILQETKDKSGKSIVETCSRPSIQNTLLDMVTSGLSMQKKQCYPVAYGGQLQLQKSVFGNTCIARRYGLKDIDATVIYKGDDFRYHIENARKVIDAHNQKFENINNDNIIGAYAVAKMEDGTEHVEIMTMPMIKQAWKQGYGYKEGGNGTHQKFTDQMAIKTVKNRLLKSINNTYGTMEVNDLDEPDVPPMAERVEADVAYDIQQNANSVPFDAGEVEVQAEVVEPTVEKVDAEVVEDADGQVSMDDLVADAPFK